MNQATEQFQSAVALRSEGGPKTEQSQKGWVTTSYRNYKGKRLGPYHYRRWKVGSQIHRQYIKPQDVERVKAECAVYSEQRRSKREGGRRVNVYLDNFIFQSKMYFRYEQGKEVRPDQEAYIVRLHKEGMYITGRPLYRPRRLFGDPLLSNFISECIIRNLNPLEAQLLSALGANIDQIERILKFDPADQGREDEMRKLFNACLDRARELDSESSLSASGLNPQRSTLNASPGFGDHNFSNPATNAAAPPSPSDLNAQRSTLNTSPLFGLNAQRSTLNAPSGFGDPNFSNLANRDTAPPAPSDLNAQRSSLNASPRFYGTLFSKQRTTSHLHQTTQPK